MSKKKTTTTSTSGIKASLSSSEESTNESNDSSSEDSTNESNDSSSEELTNESNDSSSEDSTNESNDPSSEELTNESNDPSSEELTNDNECDNNGRRKVKEEVVNNNNNNAQRFMNMVKLFDGIRGTYKRQVPHKQSPINYPLAQRNEDYLITQLRVWLNRHIAKSKKEVCQTRSDTIYHTVLILQPNSLGKVNTARQIPITINAAILKDKKAKWHLKQKVPLTWIVCYLENILPNTTVNNWESFDCSHRCIGFYGIDDNEPPRYLQGTCVTKDCLVWESKRDNQERGNRFCTQKCVYDDVCENYLCICQKLHKPCCI